MFLQLFVLSIGIQQSKGIIYHLNDTEYARMPPLFHLDPYEPCLKQGGLYCSVDLLLVADQPSQLLHMIQEYSMHKSRHYNHSCLRYGICVTETCKHIEHTTPDLAVTLEACLNELLWDKYELKAKVTRVACNDVVTAIDTGDVVVTAILIALLLLNIVGTYRGLRRENHEQGKILSCFSIVRNWNILVAPSAVPDQRMASFKGINGARMIPMMFAVGFHAMLPFTTSCDNPHDAEEIWAMFRHVGNGTLSVQLLFSISGFLLAYHLQVTSEKTRVRMGMLPKLIFLRWLRFTPAFAVVLAFKATLLRFAASGPMWQTAFGHEVKSCRRDWWRMLLYVSNYSDGGQCMGETWQLAADMQLTIVGLLLMVALRGAARARALALLCAAGALACAAHTYAHDLDSAFLITPENCRTLFDNDPTFDHVYKRGHTNLPAYVIGIASGLIVYHWQKIGVNVRKYKVLRCCFWLSFPAIILLISDYWSGFYSDIPRPSIYERTLLGALSRPAIGVTAAVLLMGLTLNLDDLYQAMFGWRGWVIPTRLSYSVYILHMSIIRSFIWGLPTLVHGTRVRLFAASVSFLVLSFLAAVPFWLLVEAPLTNLMKLLMPKAVEKAKDKDDEEVKKTD